MDSKPFDDRIAAASVELEKARAHAEEKAQTIVATVILTLAGWVPTAAKQYAAESPAVTARLSAEGKLAGVKREIEKNIQDIAPTADRVFLALWPHRQPKTPSHPDREWSLSAGLSLPPPFRKKLRALIAAVLDAPLKAAGYQIPSLNVSSSSDANEVIFPPPKEWQPMFASYQAALDKLSEVQRTIEEIEKEKAKAVASDAWDKA